MDGERVLLYVTVVLLSIGLLFTQINKAKNWPDELAFKEPVEHDSVIGTFWEDANVKFYVMLDGSQATLDDLRGDDRRLLLIFFDTDCSYCHYEAPLWQQIAAGQWNEDVTVVGVLANPQDKEVVLTFQEQYQLTYPVLVDTDGLLGARAQLEVTPTKILLSQEFQILQYWQGVSHQMMSEEALGSLLMGLGIPPGALPVTP